MKKTAVLILAAFLLCVGLSGCASDADVASRNLSKAADNFEVERRVVFFNGYTDKYLLVIEGLCSLGNHDGAREVTVTCKTPDGFKKHFLGLSNNVSYFVEQTRTKDVSVDHYRVIFKPETLAPDIDLR